MREDGLGLSAKQPSWLKRPALTRWAASHPSVLRPFADFNAKAPSYRQEVKPGNFLLVAHVAPGGHPYGVDPKHFSLLAPFDKDAERWTELPWRNVWDPDGPTYRLVGESIIDRRGRPFPEGVVGVKTYAHVLAAYRRHPEAKSAGPDGAPCSTRTVGLLSRLPVQALYVDHVGKETNLIDNVQAGLIGSQADVLATYRPRYRRSLPRFVVPALKALQAQPLSDASSLPLRTVQRACAGQRIRREEERSLIEAAAVLARRELEQREVRIPRADLAAVAAFLVERAGAHPTRTCEGCGAELTGRQRRWCSSCGSDYRRRSDVGAKQSSR